MVDCYNPNAVVRYSKLDARIREQAKIESDNEYFSKNLKKVVRNLRLSFRSQLN